MSNACPSLTRATVKDPVCGMQVSPERAAAREEYEGRTYHFCATSCAAKFRSDPRRYLVGAPALATTAAEYTCPMHPEVRRPNPGACPICGMALEPVHITGEE